MSSKRHSLGRFKVKNHDGYGEDIVAEGPPMSTLAGSALACSQECGLGLGAMLPREVRFVLKSQTTGTAFCGSP